MGLTFRALRSPESRAKQDADAERTREVLLKAKTRLGVYATITWFLVRYVGTAVGAVLLWERFLRELFQ